MKYPRLERHIWSTLSKAAKREYRANRSAEMAALRKASDRQHVLWRLENATREARKNQPRAVNESKYLNHRWSLDISARSITGTYRYKGTDVMGTNSILESRQGVTNPNWRRQVAEAKNATTSYTRTTGWVHDEPGAVRAEFTQAGDRRVVDLTGDFHLAPTNWNSASFARADQVARTTFYKKLAATQREFGGGVALGEIRDTAALIRKPYEAIPKLLNRYGKRLEDAAKKPGKRLTISQLEKKASDAWLTTTFGLLPLVGDITDAARALASLLNQERQVRIRAFGNDVVRKEQSTPGALITPSGDSGFRLGLRKTMESEAVCRVLYHGGVRVRSVGPDLASLSDISKRFGLHAQDFIPTLYELLPWSFLVDYGTSVGDVLNAWAVSYADVAWQTRSTKWSCTTTESGDINQAVTRQYTSNLAYVTGYLGKCTAYNMTYSREDPGVVPLPSLEFRSALSPVKVMNLGALRRQLTDLVRPLIMERVR